MLHFGTTSDEYALTYVDNDLSDDMSKWQRKKLAFNTNPSFGGSYGYLMLLVLLPPGTVAIIGGTVWFWTLFGGTKDYLLGFALIATGLASMLCIVGLMLIARFFLDFVAEVRDAYLNCRLRAARIEPYWIIMRLWRKDSSHSDDSFALRTFVDTLQDQANLSIWTDFQDRKLKIYLDSALNSYTRQVADMEERLEVGGLTEHEQQLYKDNIRSCAKQSIDKLVETRADWICDALPEKVEHRREADTEG